MTTLARLLAIVAVVTIPASTQSTSGLNNASQKKIAVLDDCDPRDPLGLPTGGCTLREKEGDVSFAEFGALLSSPLSAAVVGHPSWRNEPSHATVETTTTVRVTNEGGRGHTFTKVANFGGGRVPPLNQGLLPAPECQLAPGASDPTLVLPGQSIDVKGTAGLHKYQCCIHPWMRATIRFKDKK